MRDLRASLSDPAVALTAAAVMGGAGFLGLRHYMRVKTAQELDSSGAYDQMLRAQALAAPLGFNMNLPPKDALVRAMVPLWSLQTPLDAVDDILLRGRQSRFWPAKYRRSDIPPQFEARLLQALTAYRDSQRQLVET
jgi:hypothetical protein